MRVSRNRGRYISCPPAVHVFKSIPRDKYVVTDWREGRPIRHKYFDTWSEAVRAAHTPRRVKFWQSKLFAAIATTIAVWALAYLIFGIGP